MNTIKEDVEKLKSALEGRHGYMFCMSFISEENERSEAGRLIATLCARGYTEFENQDEGWCIEFYEVRKQFDKDRLIEEIQDLTRIGTRFGYYGRFLGYVYNEGFTK